MSNPKDIIIRPVLTEKSTAMLDNENKATFRVKFDATKPQIKEAVQRAFEVKVERVNTMIMPGKPKRVGRFFGRRAAWKKAIVTLGEDEVLDYFALEGVGEEHGVV
ncbi:MAG: 50S ribosomal protein L23 [Persicimonas sp.]